MRDVFIEYMVKKRVSPLMKLLRVGIVLAAIVLFYLFFVISTFLGSMSFVTVLLAFGSLYGAYLLISSMSIEFEYSLTNGELDVDKIVARRKRKRLVSVKCREAEDFGKYKAADQEGKDYQMRIYACDDPRNDDLWFFSLHHKDKGKILLVFNASEKMLSGMKPFLPAPIMHKVFRIGA